MEKITKKSKIESRDFNSICFVGSSLEFLSAVSCVRKINQSHNILILEKMTA